MRKSLILLALVAACGADRQGKDAAGAMENGSEVQSSRGGGGGETFSSRTDLTGLYEGAAGDRKNQLCMVRKGTATQFGLIVWGSNDHSCSGAGTAERQGDRLTLTMAGDSSCTIDATMANGNITLPASVPEGCSYYCGARAQLTGTRFSRTGSSDADASKAKDLAGDPLC
jgi:hypothetical protein